MRPPSDAMSRCYHLSDGRLQQPCHNFVKGLPKGSDTFDQLYRKGKEFVVVEAKGGTSELSVRDSFDKSKRVQQGSKEYVEAIIKEYEKKADRLAKSTDAKDHATSQKLEDLASDLTKALGRGKVRYVVVRQPINADGTAAKAYAKEAIL